MLCVLCQLCRRVLGFCMAPSQSRMDVSVQKPKFHPPVQACFRISLLHLNGLRPTACYSCTSATEDCLDRTHAHARTHMRTHPDADNVMQQKSLHAMLATQAAPSHVRRESGQSFTARLPKAVVAPWYHPARIALLRLLSAQQGTPSARPSTHPAKQFTAQLQQLQ